jgi:hypothetical protein
MAAKTMMGVLYLLCAISGIAQAQDVSDKKAAEAQLSQYDRQFGFAVDLNGSQDSFVRFGAAQEVLGEAEAFARAFQAKYPKAKKAQIRRVLGAGAEMAKAAHGAADRFAQIAAGQAQSARDMQGAARAVFWKQAANTCTLVNALNPKEPTCIKISAEAKAQAEAAQTAKATALAKAKAPREKLRGAKHNRLRKSVGRAYKTAWKTAPRKVLLDGAAKRTYVKHRKTHLEDLPVWIIAADGEHCRAFHMTFRRTKLDGKRWGGWRSHSSGDTYALRCPKG